MVNESLKKAQQKYRSKLKRITFYLNYESDDDIIQYLDSIDGSVNNEVKRLFKEEIERQKLK